MSQNDSGRTSPSDLSQRAREWWHLARERTVRSATQPAGLAEPEAPAEEEAAAPGSPLYQHGPHRQQPRDINDLHRSLQQEVGFNTRLAVWLTKNVGTMQCAYLFACIGIGSLVGVATNNAVLAAVFGSLSSYFLQLVLLPILSVGQNVLSRHQELQSDEMFRTSQRSFRDIEEIMAHLSAQDEELLKQTRLLLQLAGESVGTADPTPESPASPPPSTQARKSPPPRKRRNQ